MTTANEARAAVMNAAWQIFRETYKYPAIPFRSIGRECFAWALKEAHRRAREAARIAAIPAAVKEVRISDLQVARERAVFISSYRQSQARIDEIDEEISRLVAA